MNATGVLKTIAVASLITGQMVCSGVAESQIKWSGDFRFRHQISDAEGSVRRTRERIRARLGMTADVADNITVQVQFATGTGSPVSTNQTLDGGFSGKGVNLDLAYVAWKPETPGSLSIQAGKMKNPYRSPAGTEVIWDGDLRPEGIAAAWSSVLGSASVFADAGYFIIDEVSKDDDSLLIGGQAGLGYNSDICDITVGAGYYDYSNLVNHSTVYDTGDAFGNTVQADGTYRYDYTMTEVFGELTSTRFGLPVSLFADMVVNIADDVEDNTAWLVGAGVGEAATRGDWGCGYSYRRVERDAVLGAFTSSDFIGGGSDCKGHEINVDYCAANAVTMSLTYFRSEIGVENGLSYNAALLDAKFKW